SRDAEASVLRALFEQAPVAVLAVGPRGTVDILNKTARRLFGLGQGVRVGDLAAVSAELAASLAPEAPAGRFLVRADIDDRPMRLFVHTSCLTVRNQEIRIASIQNIESELGAAEFDAWRDLVRVLTHEIMNTLTPVTSLSQLVRSQASEVATSLNSTESVE